MPIIKYRPDLFILRTAAVRQPEAFFAGEQVLQDQLRIDTRSAGIEGADMHWLEAEAQRTFRLRWENKPGDLVFLFSIISKLPTSAGLQKELGPLSFVVFNAGKKAGPMLFPAGRHQLLRVTCRIRQLKTVSPELAGKLADGGSGPVNMEMLALLHAIGNCRLKGEPARVFLRGHWLSLLALVAEPANKVHRYCRTEYDFERIGFAREYLLRHYDVPPSLKELSRIVGMNEFKLKRCFREVYGNSVFAWLADYKMEIARRELENGQRSASELAYDLGYSSLQHFSKVFRKKFGVAPGSFRK